MSETSIEEIHDGIFRVNTPFPGVPGAFSFNQYLVVDDEPLLFHTGPRALFADVRDAVARVIEPARLRWLAYSHHEDDESGSLAQFLAVAQHSRPMCSRVSAMVGNAGVSPDRAPRALADGETFTTGRRTFRWLDAPHFPHGWDCGYLLETTARVLLCGDLFTQSGLGVEPITEKDILGPSEASRAHTDYFAHGRGDRAILDKLITTGPRVLACMHGSAFRGDGAAMLRALGQVLGI
jgi:flavorubredoxin